MSEMKTTSMDLRVRILETYDEGKWTQEEVAKRFRVSLGLVKKLLMQRKRTGQIEARHRFSGRKARLLPERGAELRGLLAKEPDLTLSEMKERLKLECSIAAIHWVLGRLGLTYKKRRSMRPSRTDRMSPKRVGGGGEVKAVSIRRVWSSSTSRQPRPT
jgi:transposase